MATNIITSQPGEAGGIEKEEQIRRRIGSDDSFQARQLRKMLLATLCGVILLNEKERNDAELLLGEALTNAFEHALRGGYVTVMLTVIPHRFQIRIASPTRGYCGEGAHLPEDSEEHGRGRVLMEETARNLRQSGLQVNCNYRFRGRRKIYCGRTVLSIEVSE